MIRRLALVLAFPSGMAAACGCRSAAVAPSPLVDAGAAGPDSAVAGPLESGAALESEGDVTLAAHLDVLAVAFVPPDGRYAIASGADPAAIVWDTRTGAPVHRFSGAAFGFNRVVLTRDGARAVSDGDAGLHLWTVATGQMLEELPGPKFGFATVAMAPDERTVAAVDGDGWMSFWDLDARKVTRKTHRNAVAVGYTDDGAFASWIDDADHLCRLQVKGAAIPVCHDIDAGRLGPAAVGPTSSMTGNGDGDLAIWNNETGSVVRRWSGGDKAITAVSFASTSGLAATVGVDRAVRVWRTENASLVAERRLVADPVVVALAPDGRRVLYGTEQGDVHVWTLGLSAPARSPRDP